MNRPKNVVFVRHAESLRNKAKKGNVYFADEYARSQVKGTPDHEVPLTNTGEQQALITGRYLERKFTRFDYAYHSGYERTIETLNRLLDPYQKLLLPEIRENHAIRERHAGHAYDMTEEEAEKHFPYLREYWQTFGAFFACPPGGESIAQVRDRVYQFINMLFRDRTGKNVLVVSHGGTLRALLGLLLRWNYKQMLDFDGKGHPSNCGIFHFEYDSKERKLVMKCYNEIGYPDDLKS